MPGLIIFNHPNITQNGAKKNAINRLLLVFKIKF